MSTLLRAICFAIVGLCSGCVPIPIITADRPNEISPHVSAELTAPALQLMLVPVTATSSSDNERDERFQVLTLDEPIFAKASEIAGFEQNLERTSLYLVLFPVAAGPISSNKVREVCIIGSNGKTITLTRTDKAWSPSEVVPIDRAWKSQFIELLSQAKPTTLLPIWKSAPCKSFDWAGLDLKWDDEHRSRAIQFLRTLPPQKD